MLMQRRILTCVCPQDWFAAIDLKDTYIHVSILPQHSPFLRFAFEGWAYQYKVLPFGLSLSPCVFTKVVEAALALLREVGICTLNYFDDWLILAHTRDLLCEHRDLVLRHLSHLGLQNCTLFVERQVGMWCCLPSSAWHMFLALGCAEKTPSCPSHVTSMLPVPGFRTPAEHSECDHITLLLESYTHLQ
ncbi:unnamed protein product [Leuciscus chuanchicus]